MCIEFLCGLSLLAPFLSKATANELGVCFILIHSCNATTRSARTPHGIETLAVKLHNILSHVELYDIAVIII